MNEEYENERWEGHEHDHEHVEHTVITFIKECMLQQGMDSTAVEALLDQEHPEWRTEHGLEPRARLVMDYLDRR